MNRKAVIASAIIILLIIAGVVFLATRNGEGDTARTSNQIVDSTNKDKAEQAPGVLDQQKGLYVSYSEEAFLQYKGTRLIFFHAPWCPQCRELDASMKTSTIPDGVAIFKLDYDTSQALRQKYGVTLQTTIVKVDENGNKIASYVAYDKPHFDSVREALLP